MPDTRETGRATPDPPPKPSPTVIDGKYRLERLLGEGAHGLVYEAVHVPLGKLFALKLLKAQPQADPEAFQRFRREAEALGQLQHPHIVTVTDFGVDPKGGHAYLVTELLEGLTLAEWIQRNGRMDLAQALALLEPIASAFDHAHEKGILHRDIKPANVFLCRTPGGLAPKLLDFGLTGWTAPAPPPSGHRKAEGSGDRRGDALSPRLTETGALIGTPVYAAPEVIREEPATRSSDVYSFGIVCYEVLVGRPPFEGSIGQIARGHVYEPPPRPTARGVALPPEVEEALLAALAKDPAARPASVGGVIRGLRYGMAAADWRRWRTVERPRRLFLAAALGAAAALVATAVAPLAPVRSFEHWLVDARFRWAAPRPPDPRILLISVDEASLRADPTPLTDRADEFAGTLDRAFEAGARGVALDIVLPPRWRESEAFGRLVGAHADRLTLGAMAVGEGDVAGTECLSPAVVAALGPERASHLFGLVNLQEDPDGLVRRGLATYADRDGKPRPLWAAQAAAMADAKTAAPEGEPFWIDHRVVRTHLPAVPWRQMPEMLSSRPDLFRDRLLLVGGGLGGASEDSHRVPGKGTGERVSGLVLQALLVHTILAGFPVREMGGVPLFVAALLAGLAAGGALVAGPLRTAVSWSLSSTVASVALAMVWAFWELDRTGTLLPLAPMLLALGVGPALGLAVRLRLPGVPERVEDDR